MHKHIERLRCTAFDRELSEREGALMARSKLSEDTVERLLKCQRWSVCDEGTADICGVDLTSTLQPRQSVEYLSTSACVAVACDNQSDRAQYQSKDDKNA